MKNIGKKNGSALVMTVIIMVVLMIIGSGVYTLFQANVSSYEWQKELLQARYTAEAGTNLAVCIIMAGIEMPQDTYPRQLLPDDGIGWYSLVGGDLGEIVVWIDPDDDNKRIEAANAYGVRVLGRVQTEDNSFTYGMEVKMMPENFARFACFQDDGFSSGYYCDGYVFSGPFFSNGPINIASSNSSTANDPYFYSLELASRAGGDGYYYGTSQTAGGLTTVPERGDLQIQPYERMLMGPPYFDMHAEPIPFNSGSVNWQRARTKAIDDGLYFDSSSPNGELPDNARIMIAHDTLYVKRDAAAVEEIFVLSALTEPVVWIDNGNGDKVYIKQYPDLLPRGINMPLTIGVNGDIYVSGDHYYINTDILDENNDDLLGLISVHGDIVIAEDPGDASDWPAPWRMTTDGNIYFSGTFMALDGDVHAENYSQPSTFVADFHIIGGYLAQAEGYTSTSNKGHNIVIDYDTRLMTRHPPYFPQTGQWSTIYWENISDLNLQSIEWNRY
ncbi:MAG: pilus assembly PilX N-terminal domain-containing protein [Candidatus Aegiribacteria sp.]|nr:pilus assembly PilX N-terminal domain-containing protein [Candidatus Aegiribacteria sp.]